MDASISPIPIYSTITQTLFPFKQSNSCSCVPSKHLFRSHAQLFVRPFRLSRLTSPTSNQAENGHKYFFLLDFTFAFHGWTWYFSPSLSIHLWEILMQKPVTYIQGSCLCSHKHNIFECTVSKKKRKKKNKQGERKWERDRQTASVCSHKGLVLFSVPFAG